MRELSTSGLLAEIGGGDATTDVTFDELLQRFSRRAFGVVLLVATLPAFLPLPAGAGAISGPLVALFGLQMLLGMAAPWMPRRWRNSGIRRERFVAFEARMRPWLLRIERLSRPRLAALFTKFAGNAVTGLLLLALGILLSLPIPLTNYPIGLLIVLYAFALIERDGFLLVLAWVLGGVVIALFGGVAAEAVAWVGSGS